MQATALPDCLSDDAFISFRYAQNLADGHGLRFNPGEEPLEGYTNFLWTLVLAGVMAAGFDPEPAARILGLVLASLTLLAGFSLMRRLVPDRPLVWAVPALLLASNAFFLVEAIQGLETLLLACLLTAGLAAWAREFGVPGSVPPESETAPGAGRRRGVPLSGLLFGLAALTRPEGAILFAAVVLLRGVDLAVEKKRPGRREALWIVTGLLPVAAHLIFRLTYYGDWLPHTFHAKTGGGLPQVLRGLHYVGSGLLHVLPWLLLALVALFWTGRPVRRKRWSLWVIFSLWVMATAGTAGVGGDFKPTYRFLVWALPLLAVAAATGIDRLAGTPTASVGRAALAVTALLAALGISAWQSEPARGFARQRRLDVRLLRQASDWLTTGIGAQGVLATGPSGAIPYYTKMKTIDMWGINDRTIGRRDMPRMGEGTAGHEKGDGAYVLARRPDIILFTAARFTAAPLPESAVASGPLFVSERELLQQPEFGQRYRWQSVRLPDAVFNFYRRRTAGAME